MAQLAAELAGADVRIVLTDRKDTVIAAPVPGRPSRETVFDERRLRALRGRRAPRIVVTRHTLAAKAAPAAVLTPFDRQRPRHGPRRAGEPGRGDLELVVGEAATATLAAVLVTPKNWARFGWESLTATERTLASIVGQGLTNKQAAARLFVSRHTVDSHLRHIFRKLDINSRVELAALVTKWQPDDQRVSA
jgi:DNA-binding CsgD family transcriptional regulator